MVKISDLIDDFKMNQQIQGRKNRFIDLTTYRLKQWKNFMELEYRISNIEEVKAIHIKEHIRYC